MNDGKKGAETLKGANRGVYIREGRGEGGGKLYRGNYQVVVQRRL